MGAYANHGVEYHVVHKEGIRTVIADMSNTDSRLLKSAYYAKNKDTWFAEVYMKGPYIGKIVDPDFDVLLEHSEIAMLNIILDAFHEDIEEHGWYDVTTIGSTL